MTKKPVQLILNDDKTSHGKQIAEMLMRATRLECMVAFAKRSGINFLLAELETGLAKGLQARFAVGLAFYQTEPQLLSLLLKLGRKHEKLGKR